jgi:hypothetical protein
MFYDLCDLYDEFVCEKCGRVSEACTCRGDELDD